MKPKLWARWKEGWKNNWSNRAIFVLIIICFGSSYGVGWPDFNPNKFAKLIWSLISLASGFGVLTLIIREIWLLDYGKKDNSE